MTAQLEVLLEEIDQLPVGALALLLERIASRLRYSDSNNGANEHLTSFNLRNQLGFLPKPTLQETKADLAEIFTPEELAEMDGDLDELPPLPKTFTEYISEERGPY